MTHRVTEQRDTLGRSTGYTYAKNDIPQQQTSIGYGTDGRVATAGFTHQGEHKDFIYSYLPGTHLLHTLTHPNGLTLTQSYEQLRDLPTRMDYTRADALIVRRGYTYDILGRPTARDLARYGIETQDTFGYNNRSELTSARVNSADYTYAYDAIGNRAAAVENSSGVASRTEYRTNNLNQYTAEGTFRPTFDADGNQTLIKTSTGIWSVTYNAKNRPTLFTKSDGSVTVECTYDTMGRRATKKVTTNGTLTEHRRFLYRGYLQIACCDLTRAYTPALWYILWESLRGLGGGLDNARSGIAPKGRAGNGVPASHPTQPTATRPLAIQKNGTWYTYGWDLTKNICETYRTDGRIDLAYTYTPYGEVSPAHTYDQPLRWSSEYHDVELGLVYYNYRHYNSFDGRWGGRDPISAFMNQYIYCANSFHRTDFIGLLTRNERNRDRVLNTISVGVTLEWWDDDGGPGGQAGKLSIGQHDDHLVTTGIFARAVCECGRLHIIDKSIPDDTGKADSWWGTSSYRTSIRTSEDYEDAGAFVFFSELEAEGDGGFLTSIIVAAISAAFSVGTGVVAVAGAVLASDIAIRIARNIASNEKDKWITTAVLTCNENEGGHYSKPTVDWGPIVPQNIGVRRTFAFNRGGYEHYVPISNRYVK